MRAINLIHLAWWITAFVSACSHPPLVEPLPLQAQLQERLDSVEAAHKLPLGCHLDSVKGYVVCEDLTPPGPPPAF